MASAPYGSPAPGFPTSFTAGHALVPVYVSGQAVPVVCCTGRPRAGWADSTGRCNTSSSEALMGGPAGWMAALTGRSPRKSPGALALRREVERLFWREIAKGFACRGSGSRGRRVPGCGSQWKADLVARRPKTVKPAANDRLRAYVQERLAAWPGGERSPPVRVVGTVRLGESKEIAAVPLAPDHRCAQSVAGGTAGWAPYGSGAGAYSRDLPVCWSHSWSRSPGTMRPASRQAAASRA